MKKIFCIHIAPKNCRDIPRDPVPEWGLNASKTCLLPDLKYGDGKAAEKAKSQRDSKKKLEESNIESTSHCKGALLTFSFHAFERDVIRCYLYWNGQCIMFTPNDTKTILTKIFNMDWQSTSGGQKSGRKDNEKFIQGTDPENSADGLIKRMKGKIQDRKFLNFRTCCSS